jgi:hypothetical protein
MLEAILKIGRPDGWWNRKIPIVRIIVIAVAVVCGLYVWAAYGDLISSIVWGVRHQRMANFRGQTLQVPWFWREEEWANYNEFKLTRSYAVPTLSPTVTVRYENSGPDDVQRKVNNVRDGYARMAQLSNSFRGRYESTDFSNEHYVCLDYGSNLSQFLIVNCFSRDGRWSVQILGMQPSRSDFEMILRGVASMGNPSK